MKLLLAVLACMLLLTPAALADSRALYDQATAAYERQDYESVITLSSEALGEMDATDPLRGGILHIRASAEVMTQKYDAAIEDYSAALVAVRQVMVEKPDFKELELGILWERGLAKTLNGHCSDAIIDYTEVLQQDANNARALADRGRCYAELGQKDAARADFDAAIRIEPGNEDALKWRSEL